MSSPVPGVQIRVLLVDDEPLIRNGFRFVLAAAPDVEIVGEASEGSEAVDLVRRLQPDLVLMDVRMPVMDGTQATEIIVAESDAKVVAMTSVDSEGQLRRMLLAGASGYLLKDESPQRIIDAVRRSAAGDTVFSAVPTAHLVRAAVQSEGGEGARSARERLATLTEREREVAIGVAAGRSNPEVGADLHIAPGTVKTHLEQVFVKLGVRNRVQVGVIVERAGLGPAGI